MVLSQDRHLAVLGAALREARGKRKIAFQAVSADGHLARRSLNERRPTTGWEACWPSQARHGRVRPTGGQDA